jgi:two-component system chemotaxis response regulator CheB
MRKLDPDIKKLRAGIYGGSAVVDNLENTTNIGEQNIAIARQVLSENKIRVEEKDVSGKNGRIIYLDTVTGKTRIRFIKKTGKMKSIEKKSGGITSRKIRVLIVDDSKIVRLSLRKAIESAPNMEVCGEAGDAFEANELIMATDPDVISLDVIMPKMSGLLYLKELTTYYPKPVVICSSIARADSHIELKSLRYGAAGVVDKAKLYNSKKSQNIQDIYIPTLCKAVGQAQQKSLNY